MKILRYIILSLFVTGSSATVSAQTKLSDTKPANSLCTDYHKKACSFSKTDINFKYNSQSRSALFRPGQSSKLTFTAHKNYDYRLTFAAEESILGGGKVEFKILDSFTNKVLFDSQENGATEFEFICDSSINMVVQIILPESTASSNNKVLYGCVGFLLESRPTLQTGF
jgi:hypothetical protein